MKGLSTRKNYVSNSVTYTSQFSSCWQSKRPAIDFHPSSGRVSLACAKGQCMQNATTTGTGKIFTIPTITDSESRAIIIPPSRYPPSPRPQSPAPLPHPLPSPPPHTQKKISQNKSINQIAIVVDKAKNVCSSNIRVLNEILRNCFSKHALS